MQLRFLFVLAISVLIGSSIARADDAVNPKYFANYIKLSSLLRSKGIDPGNVDWVDIEPMCTDLKTGEDVETDYNRCKYEKAILMRDFNADSDRCNTKSMAEFPDSAIAQQQISTDYVETYPTGRSRILQTATPLYSSIEQIRMLRTEDYNNCMISSSWIDPNDWSAGKRDSKM